MSGIVKDDKGQALTEFAIVVPVVLLFFLSMLQYFEIVRASQLGNYAAYIAARVYTVREPVDGADKAKEYGAKAAAMALAPIARLVPGEVAGVGGSVTSLLPSETPDILSGAVELIEGYATAYYVRLGSTLGFGKIEFNKGGSPATVTAVINYPQPVYLPGLAALWSVVAGEGIFTSLKPVRQGLGGAPGGLLTAAELYESNEGTLETLFGKDPPAAFTISPVLPYVNVQSKSAVGYEAWGSKEEYRPRKAKTNSSTSPSDPQTQKIEQMKQAKQAYEDALKNQQQKCKEWRCAKRKLDDAQAKYNSIPNDDAHKSEKQKAKQELEQAKQAEADAHAAFNSASADREAKGNQLASIQNDLTNGKSNADYNTPGIGDCSLSSPSCD